MEKEARKRETVGDNLPPPRKFTMKGLAEASADLSKLLKKLENMRLSKEHICTYTQSMDTDDGVVKA